MSYSYYDILNVPYSASIDEIKSSFRKMAKRYHPDLSQVQNASTKFKIIANAYKILSNQKLKDEYDERFLKNIRFDGENGYIKIPKSRYQYASALKNLATSGLLAQKRLKRKDRLKKFGYDILIPITENENKRGVVIKLPLPTKHACYVCYGSDSLCYLCEGIGSYQSVEELEVIINPNIDHNTIIDIDLKNFKPKKLSYFTLSNVRILIQIAGRE